jgi:hypothetical protein
VTVSALAFLLVGLAALYAVFVTRATAIDAKHFSALARALGATPHEVSTGLSAAQAQPALAGAVLGIAGAAGDETANPRLWQLLVVVPVTVAWWRHSLPSPPALAHRLWRRPFDPNMSDTPARGA